MHGSAGGHVGNAGSGSIRRLYYAAYVHCRELDRQQPMENWSIGRPFDGLLYQTDPFDQVSDRDVHVAGRTNIGI